MLNVESCMTGVRDAKKQFIRTNKVLSLVQVFPRPMIDELDCEYEHDQIYNSSNKYRRQNLEEFHKLEDTFGGQISMESYRLMD